MKKFLVVGAAAATLFAAPAMAADMPVKAPVKAPAVGAPAYNWTGFYAGAHFGGGWADPHWTNQTDPAFSMLFADYLVPGQGFSQQISGILGGGHVGYNWQSARWVFGVEASYAGADIKGTFNSPVGGKDDVFTTKIQSLMLLTGRVGYAWDNWLLYGKGGYARAKISGSVSDTAGVWAFQMGSGSDRHWHSGWTAGAGFEYALTRNWIVGVEYDYVGLNSQNYELGSQGGSYLWSVDPHNLHIVVGRVSYKFGG